MGLKLYIKNISKVFCDFWNRAQELEIQEQKLLWEQIYEEPNKDIFDCLSVILSEGDSVFSFDNKLEECLNIYNRCFGSIKEVNRIIDETIESICKKCSELYKIDDLELHFIIMVGQFFSNAFVAPYKGNNTAFYFLEKMPEQKYTGVLLAHEITHLFHFSQLIHKDKEYNPSLAERIFIEGLACFASSRICPNFTLSEYLWFSSSWEQWVIDCKRKMSYFKDEIFNSIESTDFYYFNKYFVGDGKNKEGIPTRIGYLLGYYILENLHKTYSVEEMIRWDSEKIKKEVRSSVLLIL